MFSVNVSQSILVGIVVFVSLVFAAEARLGPKLEDHYGYGRIIKMNIKRAYVHTFTCPKNYEEKKPCRLYRESLLEENKTIFCDINIESKYVRGMNVLSDDLVALSWYSLVNDSKVDDYDDYEDESKYQIRMNIINIKNCKAIEAIINRTIGEDAVMERKDNKISTVANDDGTFETFFSNPEACNATLCRASFDAKGNQLGIDDFFQSNETHHYLEVHKIDWLKDTYLIAERKGRKETVTFSLYKAGGERKILTINNHDRIPAISTTFKTIRLCGTSAEVKSEVSCTIFDANGNEISTVKINLRNEFKYISVKNLPYDEYLVFTSTAKLKHYYVAKVNSDGIVTGSLELIGFPECKTSLCLSRGELQFIKDQYCRSVIIVEPLSKSYAFKGKCFKDDDFY